MSEGESKNAGTIGWVDLTVPDAAAIRDFYQKVVGWTSTDVAMSGYNDYCMNAASGATVAGVCHSRGTNAGLPPMWLVYITVRNLDESARACTESGGEILVAPKAAGEMGRYCVIRDPAGAVAALFEASR